MNKIKKILAVFVSFGLAIGLFTGFTVSIVAATTGSITITEGSYDSTNLWNIWDNSDVTLTHEKGNGSQKIKEYVSSSDKIELSNSNLLTVKPKGEKVITTIAFTISEAAASGHTANLSGGEWSNGTATTSGKVVTWKGYASNGAPVTVYVKGACWISAVSYEYETIDNLFISTTLKEQLVFNYSYTDGPVKTTNLQDNMSYYLGSIGSDCNFITEYSSSQLTCTLNSPSEIKIEICKDGENNNTKYFYLKLNGKYIGNTSGKTDICSSQTKVENEQYQWYISDEGLICVRATEVGTNRYLGFAKDSTTSIKAYNASSSNKESSTYHAASFYKMNGDVSYSDVSMRIGFTIDKPLSDLFVSSGYEIGICVNENSYISCVGKVDGNYVTYYAAITDIPDDMLDYAIPAKGYIKKGSTIYLTTNDKNNSVRDLAKSYVEDYSSDQAVINHKFALQYLAYCA